jgi:hypothetical protein
MLTTDRWLGSRFVTEMKSYGIFAGRGCVKNMSRRLTIATIAVQRTERSAGKGSQRHSALHRVGALRQCLDDQLNERKVAAEVLASTK